jgi:hypothetical protein
VSFAKRKPEDTAEGCRSLEQGSREIIAATSSEQMRAALERSADSWAARARLLDRLEEEFNAQAIANQTTKRRLGRVGDNLRQRQSNKAAASN